MWHDIGTSLNGVADTIPLVTPQFLSHGYNSIMVMKTTIEFFKYSALVLEVYVQFLAIAPAIP